MINPDSPEIATLRAAIMDAFADVPAPSSSSLTHCHCEECAQLQDDLFGISWQALGKSIVRKHNNQLCLLDPPAFQYYLPAFLLCALSDEDPSDYEVMLYTVLYLGGILGEHEEHASSLKAHSVGLNYTQVTSVVGFLQHVAFSSDDDPDLAERAYEALVRVWLPAQESIQDAKGT